MTAQIIRGNALHLPLADESVDLVCTSPPYFGLRSYTDSGMHYVGQLGDEPTPNEYVTALIAATREMVRVLKPSGSIFVNLGDKYDGNKSLMLIPQRYAIRCVDELRLILRAEVIWNKPNGLPESVQDRVRRSHEQWFHFTKEPRYYSAVDEIREEHSEHFRRYAPTGMGGTATARDDSRNDVSGLSAPMGVNPLGKLPGSVWTIPTQPLKVPAHLGVDHFAAFPMEWPRRIIKAWSAAGGIVVDPFGGTGTTALVASVLGRHGISIDMSSDYCRLAEWRTTDPNQRAHAARVDKPAPQVEGQAALFEVGMT